MNIKSKNREIKADKYDDGFTMVEIIVVVAIMGILTSIVVPTYFSYVERAKKAVCNNNCLQLERMYDVF